MFRKKTFKTLRGKSESVNISQTDDNIMTKMKNDKQSSKKHYTENGRASNTNPTKNRGWIQVLGKVYQFFLHMGTRRVALVHYIGELSKC